MKPVLRLIRYAKPWSGYLIAAIAALFVTMGINLYAPQLVRKMISLVENQLSGDTFYQIIWIAAALLILYTVRCLFQFINRYFSHVAAWKLVSAIRCDIYDHFQSLSMGYFQDKQTGQLMSRVVNDTSAFEVLIAHAFPDLLTNVVIFLGVCVILFCINAQLALLTCIPIPFLLIVSPLFGRIRRYFRVGQQKIAEVNAVLQDNFSGMREIQAFNKQDAELRRVEEKSTEFTVANLKGLLYSAIIHPSVELLTSLGTVIVVGFGGYLAYKGQIQISDIVAFLLYINLFYAPLSTLSRVVEDIQMSVASGERVFEVLDTEPVIYDKPGARDYGLLEGSITYRDVSFSYNGEQPILKHINLDIRQGQMVALVGPTGVGKTTLTALLARFYDPTQGSILIGGIPITDMTLHCLRSQLSMVLQDVFLFNGTIMENIAYGCESATREEIVEAAKTACIHEFIEGLPEGYETVIGERGVKLSGGQKQRLSIARSILKNAPILVLDEATSAVDTQTEREIQNAIDKIAGTRTLLIIAHRLSTVRRADCIVVLDNGEIVEQGRHEELLAKNGLYQKLCSLQDSEYSI